MEIDHEGDIPVYQQLAAILREKIDSGELPARRPIPSKKTLVQQYGVSTGTVERAIQVLRSEGLLKTVMGRGLYITPPDERPQ
jgi:DNA-binding GntR family transcriptional regulator